MRYRCRGCGKEFDIPAWITYSPVVQLPYYENPIPNDQPYTAPYPSNIPGVANPSPTMIGGNYDCKVPCCPFCYSKEIEETKNE